MTSWKKSFTEAFKNIRHSIIWWVIGGIIILIGWAIFFYQIVSIKGAFMKGSMPNFTYLLIGLMLMVFGYNIAKQKNKLLDIKNSKWYFCLSAAIKNPTDVLININLLIILIIYIPIVIFYSKLYNISLIGQLVLYIIGGLLICFYYYLLRDIQFYSTFYDTQKNISKLLIKPNFAALENFEINYYKLRSLLKKRLGLFTRNMLTYDYKMTNIMKNIDIFFDASIEILLYKEIMTIPYTPHEEYLNYLIKSSYNEEPEPEQEEIQMVDITDQAYWEIEYINYEAIAIFLGSFRKNFINSYRPRAINIYAIDEFFNKWNLVLEGKEKEIFDKTKNNVDEYYSNIEKRKMRTNDLIIRFLEMLFTNIIAFAIVILISLSLYHYFGLK